MITIQKSVSGSTFTVKHPNDTYPTSYPVGDYNFKPYNDGTFSLIPKYYPIDGLNIIYKQLFSDVINGDTGSAFATFSDLQTYILTNFFKKAGVNPATQYNAFANPSNNYNASVPNIILDTDFCSDCDDLGALGLLHTLADRGECNILGVVVDIYTPTTISPAVQVVNNYYGRPNIPIGRLADTDLTKSDRYPTFLTNNYPNTIGTTGFVLNATVLYRSLLASAPDKSITICSVGVLRNLWNLYNSTGDGISPLTGGQLMATKLKEMVIMCGDYPSISGESNISSDLTGAQVLALLAANTAIRVVFSGYTMGNNTTTDVTASPAKSPVRAGYVNYGTLTRPSWDPLTVLYSVRGLSNSVDGTYFSYTSTGTNAVVGNGNAFTVGAGNQVYLQNVMSYANLGTILSNLINRIPASILLSQPNTIYINSAVPTTRNIDFQTNNLDRIHIRVNSDAETGANAGSNLEIIRRDDSGGNIGTSVWLNRATGNMGFGSRNELGKYTFDGSLSLPITPARVAAYNISLSDSTVRCDGTTVAFTTTLPTAVGARGRTYTIKKIDSSVNAITVGTTSGQNIRGITAATTFILATVGKAVTVQSNDIDWDIIGLI